MTPTPGRVLVDSKPTRALPDRVTGDEEFSVALPEVKVVDFGEDGVRQIAHGTLARPAAVTLAAGEAAPTMEAIAAAMRALEASGEPPIPDEVDDRAAWFGVTLGGKPACQPVRWGG